ncbi:MAG TPA: hypothetical protein VI504_10400 [Candidatus Eisenbacteria bacterium]|jgi:hypothetical protein
MRTVMLCLLLLAALPAWAGAEAPAPPSASNLLRLHPGPWQLPSHGTRLGMRVDPETGEAAVALRGDALASSEAALRARAEASVRLAPDGSRHAVLNGAIREWVVATIDDRGRMKEDCIEGEAAARARIEATTAAKRVHK